MTTSTGKESTLVFSVSDVLGRSDLLTSRAEIMEDYHILVRRLNELIGDKKASSRWKAGRLVQKFDDDAKDIHNIEISNLTDALSKDADYSESSMWLALRFYRRVPQDLVTDSVPWGRYLEAILLKGEADLVECLALINDGSLKTTNAVRAFVQERNRSQK